MSEPISGASEAGRCPRCRARVVQGQEWCSLCLEPLGTTPVDDMAPDPVSDPVPDPVSDPVPDSGPGSGPDSVMPRPEGLAPEDAPGPGQPSVRPRPGGDLPPGVAEAMLAELAATTAAERPLARGPLAGTSRGTRLLLGCGTALVLGLAAVLVLTLLGQLL